MRWFLEKLVWQRLNCLRPATMADAEVDYSALPLQERFPHKVRTFRGTISPRDDADHFFDRYGKSEKKDTKMRRNSSRRLPMNRTPCSDLSYKTQPFGKELSRIPTWLLSRKVLPLTAHS